MGLVSLISGLQLDYTMSLTPFGQGGTESQATRERVLKDASQPCRGPDNDHGGEASIDGVEGG